MADSNSQRTPNLFTSGEAKSWDKDQWNAYIASDEFTQHYTEKGVVDTGKLVQSIGLQGYLMLMENCKHLVVYKDKIYDADTPEGKDILEQAQKRGSLPLNLLADAEIISKEKADDAIQDAIGVVSSCFHTGGSWEEEDYNAAIQWAPDQWREGLRYSDFTDQFVSGGRVQLTKLGKTDMPSDLVDQMIDRSLNLIRIGDEVIDADTDEGIVLLENALVEGDVTLARLMEAEVFSKEEALQFHHDAVQFAEKHLQKDARWKEEEKKIVIPWIPEQWDAFVDTHQFDPFIEEGFVDVQSLKIVMGGEIFNIMISKVHTLVEVGARVVTNSTPEGRNLIQDAVSRGELPLRMLAYAGILTNSEIEKRLKEARRVSEVCFQEGAKWDTLSIKDSSKWSSDEWDAALDVIKFTDRFVKDGVVQKDRFKRIMENDLFNQMAKQSSYLIPLNNQIIDIRTQKGKEIAEKGFWDGKISVRTGVMMEFLGRDQAHKLYDEARGIAMRNFQEGKVWSDEDKEVALKWGADQWGKAMEVVNFSALFTKDGVIQRDKAVVAMGPELFSTMAERVEAFVTAGGVIYDASTKEGYDHLGGGLKA